MAEVETSVVDRRVVEFVVVDASVVETKVVETRVVETRVVLMGGCQQQQVSAKPQFLCPPSLPLEGQGSSQEAAVVNGKPAAMHPAKLQIPVSMVVEVVMADVETRVVDRSVVDAKDVEIKVVETTVVDRKVVE